MQLRTFLALGAAPAVAGLAGCTSFADGNPPDAGGSDADYSDADNSDTDDSDTDYSGPTDLQNDGNRTGSETTALRLRVREALGTIGSGDTITDIRLTVSLAGGVRAESDGGEPVDLTDLRLRFEAAEVVTLHNAETADAGTNQFTVSPLGNTNRSDSDPADGDDGYIFAIPLADGELTPDLEVLDSGETAPVTILPAAGQGTEVSLEVPNPMPYAEVGARVDLEP